MRCPSCRHMTIHADHGIRICRHCNTYHRIHAHPPVIATTEYTMPSLQQSYADDIALDAQQWAQQREASR